MAGPWEDYQQPQSAPQAQAQPQQAAGPWNDYVSTTADVLQTIPAGLARGVAGVIGLPGTVQGLVGEAVNWAGEKAGFPRKELPESPLMPSTQAVTQAIETQTGPLYQPQTRAGRYANTIAEFVPAAAAGPGNLLKNLVTFGVLPGVVSEGAGEVAQNIAPSLEGPARAIGAIGTGLAAAMLTRPTSAQAINQYARGATPQQLQQAEALFAEAQSLGMPITRAEALQHVTNGATRMADLQRVLEGQGELQGFFANRGAQNEQAFGNVVRDVQPQPTIQPSTIGPQAAEVAGGIIGDVRRTINNATEPYYQAAAQAYLSPADMQRIRRTVPGFDEAAAAIRSNPQLNRYVANLPDNSVGFLNEVKKYLDQASENAAGPMNVQRNQQVAAGYGQDAQVVRQAGIDATGGQGGAYDIALRVQEESRRRFLNPLLQGPLGKLAKNDQPTQAAINALFPTNPLPNSADEIATAIGALSHRRPHVARDLVRAHLESTFNEATQNLIGGTNQWGGAKFAATIRGNPQQAANLEAAIRALPNGNNTWNGVDRFLTILEAQGTRQRPGSMTAFNQELLQDLRGGTVPGAIAKNTFSFTKIPAKIAETWERWRLGKNTADLARLLTDPRAAREFQRLASVNMSGPQAVALMTRLTNIGLMAPRE